MIEGRGHIDQSLVIQVVDNINLSSSSASEVIRYFELKFTIDPIIYDLLDIL